MRILHIINSLNIGGAESLLAALMENWDGENHVLVLQGEGHLSSRLKASAASLTYVGASTSSLDFPRMVRGVQRAVDQQRPDIIHSHLVQSDLLSLLINGRGARRVTSIHVASIQPTDPPRSRVIAHVVGLLSRRFSVAIATSSRSIQYVEALGYKCPSIVINNGTPVVQEVQFDADKVVFLSLARFNPVKGHLVLLAAFDRHLESYPESHLVCAGAGVSLENPEFASVVRAALVGERTIDSIDFIGPQLQITPLFEKASALVISSKSETFPMVGSEACMHGVPVITTDVGDATSFALDENLIVAPDSVSELTAAMNFYAHLSPDERIRISSASRQKALVEFDVKITAARYLDVYRSVFHGRNYSKGLS